LPAGTTVSASFPTDDGKGAGNLIDGDSETMMIGAAGSAPTPDTGSSIFFRFPEPLTGLGGVKTGGSDSFQNYYPIAMDFWVDSDGDGTFDTKVGGTSDLGPGDKSVGDHLFDGRLEKVYGLEVRVVEQSAKSLKRAFQMGEIGLEGDTSGQHDVLRGIIAVRDAWLQIRTGVELACGLPRQ